MSEPVNPDDEPTESIPRKREDEPKPKSEWEEWFALFRGNN